MSSSSSTYVGSSSTYVPPSRGLYKHSNVSAASRITLVEDDSDLKATSRSPEKANKALKVSLLKATWVDHLRALLALHPGNIKDRRIAVAENIVPKEDVASEVIECFPKEYCACYANYTCRMHPPPHGLYLFMCFRNKEMRTTSISP
jgi:hypothetical protein